MERGGDCCFCLSHGGAGATLDRGTTKCEQVITSALGFYTLLGPGPRSSREPSEQSQLIGRGLGAKQHDTAHGGDCGRKPQSR